MRHLLLIAAALLLAAPTKAQDQPLVMAHYMPWYQSPEVSGYWGWHWTMGHFDLEVKDETGRRELASKFYPEIGPYDSRDPDVLEYHMLLMKMAGIDGVIVDWYGIKDVYDYKLLHETTQMVFEAAKAMGLKFAICFEDATVQSAINTGAIEAGAGVATGAETMAFLADNWFNDAAYARVDGQPLMLVYGPQFFKTQDDWTTLLGGIGDPPLTFMIDNRTVDAAAGAFSWPPMWMSGGGELTQQQVHDYVTAFETKATDWPHQIAGVFPGFDDIYEEAGRGFTYGTLAHRDGLMFRELLIRALNSGSDVIQLITWNDFGEGTNIEPTREYGYRYLNELQSAARERWNTSLPYVEADFELAAEAYAWRKRYPGDPAIKTLLDGAVQSILSGNTAQARSLLIPSTEVEALEVPQDVNLTDVFPNPFADTITLRYTLAHDSDVRLTLMDMLGRPLRARHVGRQAPGPYEVRWNTAGLASGVYMVRIEAGASSATHAVVRR